MMPKQLSIVAILFLLIICSCDDTKKPKSDHFIINGTLFNAKDATLYFEEFGVEKNNLLDSIKVDKNGKFTIKYKPKQLSFYILKLDEKNAIKLLIDMGETITLTGNARGFRETYNVEGSEGSILMSQINKKQIDDLKEIELLYTDYVNSFGKENFLEAKVTFDSAQAEMFNNQRLFMISFIENNLNSLASIYAIYQLFGNKPLINRIDDLVLYEKLSKSLMAKYPDNDHVKDLNRSTKEIKDKIENQKRIKEALQLGKPAPDIISFDLNNKMISLSSLKGSYVFLNFWSAKDAAFRHQKNQLKPLYQKYKVKGFEIYTFYLDSHKDVWESTVKQDKIEWITVSDLLSKKSPVVELYNIEYLPYNFLINKDGNIIKKDITIDELKEFLSKL